MFTLEQYINSGDLPGFDFLSEADYEYIFNSVGIPFDKSKGEIKDRKLTEEALERLKFNAKVNKALMTEKAHDANKFLLSSYDDLIEEEKGVIEAAKGKYDDAIPDMSSVVNQLVNEKNIHENTMANFTFSNANDMLNGLQQARINSINEKMEKNASKLEKEYKNLDTLSRTMSSVKTDLKKKRTERRMYRVSEKILKLREKQGRLIGQQRQIVNAAIVKYTNIKNKQMKQYGYIVAGDKRYVDRMDDLTSQLQAAESDKRITEAEIFNLGPDAKGKFVRSLRADSRKLERQINSLNRKIEVTEKLRQLRQRINALRGKNGIEKGFGVIGRPFGEHQVAPVGMGM